MTKTTTATLTYYLSSWWLTILSFKELRLELPMSLEASASSMFKASTLAPVSNATLQTFSVIIQSTRERSSSALRVDSEETLKEQEKGSEGLRG